jgi:hypothetical protein
MTRSISRIAALALAAAALAAPAAFARPADAPSSVKASPTPFAEAPYPTRPAQGEQANPRPEPPVQPTVDPGTNWTAIGLGIGGSLLAIAAIGGLVTHARHSAHAGHGRIAA